MNKIILGILLGVTLLTACKKSNNSASIDSGLLANFNYQPGTYWIYRDSITGVEDSFFVTGNEGGTTAGIGGQVQERTIFISAYNINTINSSDTEKWEHTLIQNYLVTSWSTNTDNNIPYSTFLTYPFKIGYLVPSGSSGVDSNAQIQQIIPNLTLNGKNYSSVAIISQSGNGHLQDLFYINTDVGPIKMDINNFSYSIRRVWKIERWKVIK